MITDCNIVNIESNNNLDNLLKKAFFIDIETTGLSKIYSDIISITAMLYENGCYKIHQVFCEYKMDELEALKYLKDLINQKKYVITYNGNSFDIPFLAYKFQKHCINFDFDSFVKIDLYNWLRHLKNKIQIENLKLKSVEEYFNIKRNDCISGKDVAVLYKAYKIDPRKEFSYLIMRHNYEDVFNLPKLLNSILDLYDDVLYYNGLIVKINSKDFNIKKNNLYCKFGIISDRMTDYVYPGINFNLNMNSAAQTMELNILLSFFKDDKISEFYFVNNNEYKVKTYTAIEGIKKNLIPVKFNSKIFYNNIINILKKIMNSIF
jgi:hypothetical protein